MSLLMASVMCLHLVCKEEDMLEHTQCQVSFVYTLTNLQTFVYYRHTSHDIIEHTHVKILVNALECQVS